VDLTATNAQRASLACSFKATPAWPHAQAVTSPILIQTPVKAAMPLATLVLDLYLLNVQRVQDQLIFTKVRA